MVIYGRDERLRDGVFAFLRSVDLSPIEWSHAVQLTGKAAPYVGEVLDAAFSDAQAVVVVLSPDDVSELRQDLRGAHEPTHETEAAYQARPNVLFESGMAMARHPDRTVIIEIGQMRRFSDIGGRHTIRMDNSVQKRQELAQRLQSAGCSANLLGTDWHTAGDMRPPELSPPVQQVQVVHAIGNQSSPTSFALADLISELEDNLRMAKAPRVGSTYRRPSSQTWKAVRNKLQLPGVLRSDLTVAYDQIDAWGDQVDRGLNPD
jgi:hypothetical protein